MAHLVPRLQLTVEETHDGRIAHGVAPALRHVLTGVQLHGAQAVFIQIVGINLIDRKGCIGIASPTTAEIEFSIDSANAIMAREHQSQGIVFTIGSVRELYLTKQRCKEGTWST